jgi:hypothetical protein
VFELPSDLPKLLDLARLQSRPGLVEAATFGTERDAWFLERLSRDPRLSAFQAWCAAVEVPTGRGLGEEVGSRTSAALRPMDGSRAHLGTRAAVAVGSQNGGVQGTS